MAIAKPTTTIIINGRKIKKRFGEFITYSTLWSLAFNSTDIMELDPTLTATYSKAGIFGDEEGMLCFGDKVKIRKGMIFNITSTSKA